MLQHVMSITIVAAMASASPAPSQIRANSAIYVKPAKPVPGVMVANPVLTSSGDSSVSVLVADGIRDRLTRAVGGSYTVVTKRNMNIALATFGFAENELLNTASATRLASQIGGTKLIVTSVLQKGADGRFTITARVANVGGTIDAGHVVTVAQAAGQPLGDFGAKVADGILPALKAWPEATSCIEQASTKPEKASEAAAKAFKTAPGLGLASYCLAEMAKKRDSVGTTTLTAWQEVVKGDPLSLTSWNEIAVIYQIQKDSAKVIETYQQMLRIAPTNQVLRDAAYKVFAGYGRPDAAMAVVEEGIKLDPANTDWYDLKSNVCIGQGDLTCAIASLEEVFNIDSTRADTNFYAKILYAAKEKPDTAKYLTWAKRGAEKYPSNPGVLEELAIAYGWVGQSDMAVTTAKQMIMVDDTKTDALMRVVKSLVDAKKYREAISLAPTVKGLSGEEVKNDYGGLVLPAAQALQQTTPTDNALLVEVSEAILSVGPSNPQLIIFSNFFLSVGLRQSVVDMSTAVRATSATCEQARAYDAVLTKIEPALASAATSTTEGVANFAKQLLPSVQSEKTTFIGGRITALCK
jgi:Tfp pilus assembly protein PilF